MKIRSPLAALAMLISACAPRKQSESKPPADTMASTAGMPGMVMPATNASDSGSVGVDRAVTAREGISFARATVAPIRNDVLLGGTVAYPESSRQVVTTRVNGWVETLNADYVGKPVRAGDALLTLYAPELVGAEEEYLTARRLGDSALTIAARRRLSVWNLPADQLAAVDSAGVSRRTLTLTAPRNGEIAEKMVTAGQAVRAGDALLVIADRATLWVNAAVHETDASVIRIGTPVALTVRGLPGRTWRGRVTFLQPTADSNTRTLTARIEVANSDGQLRPGMYATVAAAPAGRRALSVPLTAVLPTGTRNLVFVNRGDGRFVPRDVQVGVRGDSLIEIVSGLRPGDEVVASATYLIDSESNLAAAMQGLMLQMGMRPGGGQPRPSGKDRAP